MKRIMFNDRYGLTQAVIEGRKIVTRRIEGNEQFQYAATSAEDFTHEEDTGCIVMCCQGMEIFRHKCQYKAGEVIAVGQRYVDIHLEMMEGDYGDPIYDSFRCDHVADKPGWYNKMAARADLMPHRIRITDVRCERLWDITDKDCMREGIWEMENVGLKGPTYWYSGLVNSDFRTPREAFASLIDKISGRGTWDRNPWVVVYEFETLK